MTRRSQRKIHVARLSSRSLTARITLGQLKDLLNALGCQYTRPSKLRSGILIGFPGSRSGRMTLKTKCSNDVWSRTYSDTGVTFSIELKGLYSTKLPRGYHSLLSLVLSTGHMRQLISNYPTSRFFSKSMTPSQVNFLRILANELSTILSSAQKLPSPTAIR